MIGKPIYEMTKYEKFIQRSLYCGFFTTVDGDVWFLNKPLDYIEIHPIYLWKEGDIW